MYFSWDLLDTTFWMISSHVIIGIYIDIQIIYSYMFFLIL